MHELDFLDLKKEHIHILLSNNLSDKIEIKILNAIVLLGLVIFYLDCIFSTLAIIFFRDNKS